MADPDLRRDEKKKSCVGRHMDDIVVTEDPLFLTERSQCQPRYNSLMPVTSNLMSLQSTVVNREIRKELGFHRLSQQKPS